MKRSDFLGFVALEKQYFSEKKAGFAVKLDRYADLCMTAVTPAEFFELADLYAEMWLEYIVSIKHVYNSTIG